MTSRAIRLFVPLLAAAFAACGGPQQSQPAPAAPAPASAPAATTPDGTAAPAATAAAPARPTTRGPNLTPDGVVFNFKPEGKPKQIFLAGNFNEWKPSDPKFLLKDDDGDGIWSITVKLPPGTYQYKYVADGQWTQDSFAPGSAPDGFGGRNSQFDVK
jgi:hypothetical protein